jgi:hypothetical protein
MSEEKLPVSNLADTDTNMDEEDLTLVLDDQLRFDHGLEEPEEVSEISRDAAVEIRDSINQSLHMSSFGLSSLYTSFRKRSKSHPENLILNEFQVFPPSPTTTSSITKQAVV